jgi:hypothetical protein
VSTDGTLTVRLWRRTLHGFIFQQTPYKVIGAEHEVLGACQYELRRPCIVILCHALQSVMRVMSASVVRQPCQAGAPAALNDCHTYLCSGSRRFLPTLAAWKIHMCRTIQSLPFDSISDGKAPSESKSPRFLLKVTRKVP